MMREIGHFIGGKPVNGTSGRSGDVFNPNTGEVQAKVALASKSEVEQAIADAEAAFPGWAATNPQRRARVMFKFLELIQSEYDDLARLLSSEHGKTFADSKGDIQRGLEVVEFIRVSLFTQDRGAIIGCKRITDGIAVIHEIEHKDIFFERMCAVQPRESLHSLNPGQPLIHVHRVQ